MKRPDYMEELLGIIFLWVGIAFIVSGLFCFSGFLAPTEDSRIQTANALGIFYCLVGILFLLVQAVLKIMTSLKDKKHRELLACGTKVRGTVDKVYLQKYTQYGKASPYRIHYTYAYQDRIYHHKSRLLWEKPDCKKQDSIVVYADDFGKSTIQ